MASPCELSCEPLRELSLERGRDTSSRACDRAPALVRLWDFGLSSSRPDASLGLCRLTEAPLLRVPDVARLLWGPDAPASESLDEACEDERPFRDALEPMRSGRCCDALCDEARVLRLAPEPLLPEGKCRPPLVFPACFARVYCNYNKA